MNMYNNFVVACSSRLVPAVAINVDIMSNVLTVLNRIERTDPDLSLEWREGYSYAVHKEDGAEREVYMFCEAGEKKDYNALKLVSKGSEGDAFYKTPLAQRFTQETVSEDLMNALQEYDVLQSQFKKIPNLPEAVPHNCAGAKPAVDLKPH